MSVVHGDLGTPEACLAIRHSAERLVAEARGPISAVAHDLHPDFESTRLALAWAHTLNVPAIAVQHHHAHLAVVDAERGARGPAVGFALDGVGLGTDGHAWGGELLWLQGACFERLSALTTLKLPGGDVAAREPWRMAAAVLDALGRAGEIEARFGVQAGATPARIVATLLARNLHCPLTTSAGRWFDAAAGLLGVSVRQSAEAEAAIALERLAGTYLASARAPAWEPQELDLRRLGEALLALVDARGEASQAEGAALFHVALAAGLASAGVRAARAHGLTELSAGGGCFFNSLLTAQLRRGLAEHGLTLHLPCKVSCGDAGLALGQAWIAAHTLTPERKDSPCA